MNTTADIITSYSQAFDAYRKGLWVEAAEGFQLAAQNGVGAAESLRARCETLKIGHDQHKFRNGVWILDEK